jgi:hypothetical protein
VLITADETGLVADGLVVGGYAPCAGALADATGTFAIVADVRASPSDEPPAIAITTPASVSCGANVTLTASTSDPDNDLDSVRRYVDDVLISPSTSKIRITQAHVLRAVAYDARGAATTTTKGISCT